MKSQVTARRRELETDVLVVGGGSGLAAAIEAARAGRKVVLLEKNPATGESTGWSVGSITATRTPDQRRLGLVDDPAHHFEDMRKVAGAMQDRDNLDLRRMLVLNVTDTVAWLRSLGVEFFGPVPESPHRLPRMHNVLPTSGSYVYHLTRAAWGAGVDIHLSTRAQRIVLEGGSILGIEAENATGDKVFYKALRGVVLAGGGDSCSAEFKAYYGSEALARVPAVNQTNTGDCQRMVMDIGGEVLNGDLILGPVLRFAAPWRKGLHQRIPPWSHITRCMAWMLHHLPAAVIRPFVMRVMTAVLAPEAALLADGVLLLDREGRRIEPIEGSLGKAVAVAPGNCAWLIFDSRMAQRYSSPPHAVSTAPGVAWAYFTDYVRTRRDLHVSARDVKSLAIRLGMPWQALAATVTYGTRVETAPRGSFHAVGPIHSYVVLTDGGVKVTPHRLLNTYSERLMIESWSLPDVLEARARTAPYRPFFSMIGEPALSVGDLELRSRRLANGLRELGISFGDRVLVMMPNCTGFIEAWFAINRLGAVLVTVNTGYRGVFLEHLANNSDARVMIVAPRFLPTVLASEAAMPKLEILVMTKPDATGEAVTGTEGTPAPNPQRLHIINFESLGAASERGIDVHVAPTDLSAIVYTSGTTGKSKGVMIPHAQMYLNPLVYLEQLGLGRDDVFYSALPLFHTNALALQVYGALIAGCSVHLAPQFSASRWLDDVRASGATVTNLLGVMTDFVFRQEPTPHDADNALRIASAVPTPPSIAPAFERRFGVQLVELYGSTEANCPLYQPRDEARRDGTCGKVVDRWFECRIADADTDRDVPVGEVGELLVRPNAPYGFMAGYNAMPEETVKAWRNLWFHTGDAMRRDADGYHYFVDRMKDCIRRRAENISSFEVEQVVMQNEAVEEVAAVGIRSPLDEHEQEVKIFVVCRAGVHLDAAALHAFCADRMPAFAVPRFVEFCTELPKTPTQKVRKQELRERGINPETWAAPDTGARGRAVQSATRNPS